MSEWNADEWRSEVEVMTTMLRTSDVFPFWAELRRELNARGVDPAQSLLVESHDVPPAGDEVGVVLGAGRVLAYRVQGGERSWADLTEGWEASDFADQVRVGLAMLAR